MSDDNDFMGATARAARATRRTRTKCQPSLGTVVGVFPLIEEAELQPAELPFTERVLFAADHVEGGLDWKPVRNAILLAYLLGSMNKESN